MVDAPRRSHARGARLVGAAALGLAAIAIKWGLFDQLDAALKLGCDHTLRHTCAFLKAKGLSESTVVLWLGTYGGFCDCEVLGNVEAAWVR